MTRLTYDGMRTFTKPETAAEHSLDHNLDPSQLQVLSEGALSPAAQWQVDEVLAHMRDLAPPC